MRRAASLGDYRRVLATPGVPSALCSYVLARLPTSMVLLALLLFLRRREGSFAVAGLSCAAYGLSVALAGPVLGRLIDRRGQAVVLRVCGVAYPTVLGLLVANGVWRHGAAVLLCSVAAGAVQPPVSACMRALWPRMLVDDRTRQLGYAIESVLIESIELLAPLTVTLCLALGSARLAVELVGSLSGMGALALSLTDVSRGWSPETVVHGPRRGALSAAGVRTVLGVICLSTAGFGALEIGVAGFVAKHNAAAATGTLLAVWGATSLVGGLIFGARREVAAPVRSLVWMLGVGGALTLLPLLATSVVQLGAALAISGVLVAPAIAIQLRLMYEVAPAGAVTEAFTWAGTMNFLGLAIGNAVGGVLIDRRGAGMAFVAGAGCTAAAAAFAWARRRSLAGAGDATRADAAPVAAVPDPAGPVPTLTGPVGVAPLVVAAPAESPHQVVAIAPPGAVAAVVRDAPRAGRRGARTPLRVLDPRRTGPRPAAPGGAGAGALGSVGAGAGAVGAAALGAAVALAGSPADARSAAPNGTSSSAASGTSAAAS